MEYLGPGAEDVSPQAAAGILVERLKHSGHLGDRREALGALLALSKKHPTEVGLAGGMPTFTDILQAGVADGAMTQTIMEIIINLVSERDVGVAAGGGGGDVRVGANIDAFLRDVQNVQTLLDLLESQDTLTAMSAVQASRDGFKCLRQEQFSLLLYIHCMQAPFRRVRFCCCGLRVGAVGVQVQTVQYRTVWSAV